MKTTPQERLALGVVALLLAAGTAVHLRGTPPAPAQLTGTGALPDGAAAETTRLAQRVSGEVERARRRGTRLAAGERIDPNTADIDELQRLPRVGPALAGRIIAHRETHGAFRTLADLDAVSGVGPALLDAVAPHVALPPAPPAAAPRQTSAGVAQSASRPAAGPAGEAGPLDLNRATAEELVRLPGIGPVLAQRIVEWRQVHGPFRSVEELQQVSGIGPHTVSRLAPLVRVGP